MKKRTRILGTVATSVALGLFVATPPAEAGFWDALDKLMKDYATGLKDHPAGDAVKNIIKPPEGSGRGAEIGKAFGTYADSFYKEGSIGDTAQKNLVALVGELKNIGSLIPGAGSVGKKLAGLKARFLSRAEKPWDDAAAEAAYKAAAGGAASAGGGNSMLGGGHEEAEPPPPPPPPKDSPRPPPPPAGDAGGEEEEPEEAAPPKGGDESKPEEGNHKPEMAKGDKPHKPDEKAPADGEAPALDGIENPLEEEEEGEHKASGIAPPADAPSAPESEPAAARGEGQFFACYVHFLKGAGETQKMAEAVEGEDEKGKAMSAVGSVYGHAEDMKGQMVDRIIRSAREGKDSVGDLHRFASRLSPQAARYYLGGVVQDVSQRLKMEGGAAAKEQSAKLSRLKEHINQ